MNPQRYINGFEWDEFKWRRGELAAQFAGKTVMIGVDDMDIFKGIELKLLAFERLLELHAEVCGEVWEDMGKCTYGLWTWSFPGAD